MGLGIDGIGIKRVAKKANIPIIKKKINNIEPEKKYVFYMDNLDCGFYEVPQTTNNLVE